jgi:hypothetical protein
MNLCGEYVTHRVFGKGQITTADDQCVTVLFGELQETKRFVYPSAFGTFLTPVSQTISLQIQEYKDGLARSLADAVVQPAVKELPKKEKKPTPRKPKKQVLYDIIEDI